MSDYKSKEKIQLTSIEHSHYITTIGGEPIDELIKWLKDSKAGAMSAGMTDVRVEIKHHEWDEQDSEIQITVVGDRMETIEEFKYRQKRNQHIEDE